MKQRGFTLMELMIVVAIIGIIAAFAYPSYQDSVRKSRRADAKQALTDAAARLEQYYISNKSYTSDVTRLGYASATSQEGYYTLAIAAPTGGTLVTGYVLTATPTTKGGQDQDSACASMTLASTGARTPAAGCW